MDKNETLTEELLKNANSGDLPIRPAEYSALALAYIGDCVYELYVRTHLLKAGNNNVNSLHKTATKYVRCAAQSQLYYRIEPLLTEEETAVFKRGRNTKSHVPKNSEMSDYRNATGIEALIGYLYLSGKYGRISELTGYLFAEK